MIFTNGYTNITIQDENYHDIERFHLSNISVSKSFANKDCEKI